jgi:hypothetical protein
VTTTQLETDHGRFLCAEDGGGTEGAFITEPDGTVRPTGLATGTRERAGAWETFEVERDEDPALVYLISAHGQYGCAEAEGQDGRFVFNREHGGAWEALRPLEMPDGRVAFEVECRRGCFLCAEPDGHIVIRQPMFEEQPSETPGGYESFTSSADLFPEAPIPVPPPGGGTGIPVAGPVRILGEVFSDDNGAFLPIGCHFGEAFSAWCRGQQAEVRQQVRTIRAAGYDHIRVWLNLGFYDSAWHGREVAFTRFRNKSGHWVEATPNYSDHRIAFNQMLLEQDIRGLFSRGDCNSIAESEIQHHLLEERRVLSHHPQVVFGTECANEKWQNFPPAIAENEPKARQMMEAAFGGTGWLLQNSCPPGSGEEASAFAHMVQGWFPSANVHGTRNFRDMEFVLRHFFNYGYERYPAGYTGKKYALESTEPGGPGQGVSVGNTSELWKIMAMHAATLIGRTGTVYMSGFGVFWDGPIESQVGFWEVPQLRALFQSNAFLGQALHGGRGEAWVTSNGGFSNTNPNGYARIDQLIYDRDCVAIAHHGGSGRALRFKVGGSVSIRNWDLTERMAFEVEPNYVRDVGGDCLVVMRAGRKRGRTDAALGSRRR